MCLQACLTTGWTCHRDQPLQSQTQNRDAIDNSSFPHMLVSSRTAPHALTKNRRNEFSKNKTHGDSQRTFVPGCLWSGGLFSRFSGQFLVSFLGLGPLWDNFVSSPEFDRDFDVHFDILLDHFSAFLPMLFSRTFRFFPRPLFSQLPLKMHAFGAPTGSSGNVFSCVFMPKAKSQKVTFCLDRTPYIEARGGSDRSVASIFSTPALREATAVEKHVTKSIFQRFSDSCGAPFGQLFVYHFAVPKKL